MFCLAKLVKAKLTKREKKALLFILNNPIPSSVSQCIKEIALELNCAPSTAWNILRSLRNCGLIDCTEKHERKPLQSTGAAKCLQELKNE
ncbi:hypothetical protein HZA98_01050 [Candidatus Woesearchaeota archaeon]|nr:hypothetical protein [Candidatus Woesearchaeota archaeon]